MGPEEQGYWKDEALTFLLGAVAADAELRALLIFKGARILYQRLGTTGRRSLDLDTTLRSDRHLPGVDNDARAQALDLHFRRALQRAVRQDDPVRYGLKTVRVTPLPSQPHPRGWQGFVVKVALADLRRHPGLAAPTLEVEVAAPEALTPTAISPLDVGKGSVWAYSTSRQTAEKLRAFLQSSPPWREKVKSPLRGLRVKDLVDLAEIVKRFPLADDLFWNEVASEFVAACADKVVDCEGWSTFAELEHDARIAFASEVALRALADFDACWQILEGVIAGLARRGIFPIAH